MDDFEITELSIPVSTRFDGHENDLLSLIEEDLIFLIRRQATLKSESTKMEQSCQQRMKYLLMGMVESVEGFERILVNIRRSEAQLTEQAKRLIENFSSVFRFMNRILAENDVVPTEAPVGEFNPELHKAVDVISDQNQADGMIVETVNRGYYWNDQVLRKDEVVVVRNQTNDIAIESS